MFGLVLYLLISLALGGVICFLGRRLYFPAVCLLFVVLTFSLTLTQAGMGWRSMLMALGISVLGAALTRLFFNFGVFITGALCGAMVGSFIGPLLPTGFAQYGGIIILLCAVLLGALSVIWWDKLLVLTVAFAGAAIMVTPVCFFLFERGNLQSFVHAGGVLPTMTQLHVFLGNDFFASHTGVILAASLAVAAISFFVQNLPLLRRRASSI